MCVFPLCSLSQPFRSFLSWYLLPSLFLFAAFPVLARVAVPALRGPVWNIC